MITLLLLSCQPKLDPGEDYVPDVPEVPDWSSYEGTYRWLIQGAGAEEPGCDLYFDFSGGPAESMCEDCEYAFTLEMSYDDERSTNTWGCIGREEHEFTWTIGYDADFYGYDVGAIWMFHEYGAYWTQAFYATLDGDTLSFAYNYYSSAYYYDYYIYSYSGSGTVTE